MIEMEKDEDHQRDGKGKYQCGQRGVVSTSLGDDTLYEDK